MERQFAVGEHLPLQFVTVRSGQRLSKKLLPGGKLYTLLTRLRNSIDHEFPGLPHKCDRPLEMVQLFSTTDVDNQWALVGCSNSQGRFGFHRNALVLKIQLPSSDPNEFQAYIVVHDYGDDFNLDKEHLVDSAVRLFSITAKS